MEKSTVLSATCNEMILAARVKLGIDTFFDLAHMTHALDLLLCTRQGEVR